MRLRTVWAGTAALALVAAACAKPPIAELEAKREQVRVAIEESEAEVYAPQAAQVLRDSFAAVETAISAQSRRLPFLRKYDGARQRLDDLAAPMDDMRRQALLGKETLRTEAASLIEQAAALADSAESESRGAPAVKGARALTALIQGEIVQLREQIEQARASLAAEQIAGAHDQAGKARERARQLLEDVRGSRSRAQAVRARRHAG